MLWNRLAIGAACVVVLVLSQPAPAAQPPAGTAATPATAQPEIPKDPLGRSTPRGALLGFLNAARDGKNELAAQYLNTQRPTRPPRISPTSCTWCSTPGCRRDWHR